MKLNDTKRKIVRITSLCVSAVLIPLNAKLNCDFFSNNNKEVKEFNISDLYFNFKDPLYQTLIKWKDFDSCCDVLSAENDFRILLNGSTLYLMDLDKDRELSDKFYSNLSLLIESADVNKLYLEGLSKEFDFSKLELSNIVDLSIYDCTEKFDTAPLIKRYNSVSFDSSSTDVALDVISNCDIESEKTKVDIYADSEMPTKCLDLPINSLRLVMTDENSKEILNTLGQLNAREINIDISNLKEMDILNLDLTLNPNTYSIKFYDEKGDPRNLELGNISIKSSHLIDLKLCGGKLTENTRFMVPDASHVSLYMLPKTDLSAISDLRNVEYIHIRENSEEAVSYYSSSVQGLYDSTDILIYRDFDEFLENLETVCSKEKTKAKK